MAFYPLTVAALTRFFALCCIVMLTVSYNGETNSLLS